MNEISDAVAREVLLGPDFVARAAAQVAGQLQQRWMLCQSREVRRSYVEQVMDGVEATEAARQIAWMLRAPDAVRRSYIDEVAKDPSPQMRWMLAQPAAVRESYVREVVLGPGAQP